MQKGAIVLCGGQSRRMGRPKAWLPFGDELMLPRMVRILSEVVPSIVVVAAPEQEVPPLPASVEIVRDEERNRGPLEGLLAGLKALESRCDAVYLSSCDVPFLRPQFSSALFDFLGESSIAVPQVDDYHHPLAAVYRPSIRPVVEQLLGENRLRPVYLFEIVPTRVLRAEELQPFDPKFDSLRNLNTPEEYEQALAEFTSR
jgi:molybdopterin-guanine dinucleotide biosynthesis protein A